MQYVQTDILLKNVLETGIIYKHKFNSREVI